MSVLHKTSVISGCLLLGACSSGTGSEVEPGPEPQPVTGPLDELPVIEADEGFFVDEGTFTVGPGQEVVYCVRIPIPERWSREDIALIGWDADLPAYTHHFFFSYSEEPLDAPGPVPCDGENPIGDIGASGASAFDFDITGERKLGKFLLGAGEGLRRTLGNGEFGKLMKAGGHLVTNHHVLNTSNEAVRMHGRFNLLVKPADEIAYPTNVLNCLSLDIAVEPRSSAKVTARCLAPWDLRITTLGSHAHNHLTLFETRFFDGDAVQPAPIYTSSDWDSPLIIPQEEPILLRRGQGLEFTCHYENPGDAPVGFGFGVDNEMCATMNGYAFTEDRPFEKPPALGQLIVDNEAPLCGAIGADGAAGVSDDCTMIDTDAAGIDIF